MPHDELDAKELDLGQLQALRALRTEVTPPPEMEADLVGRLREAGTFTSRSPARRFRNFALVAAAALVAFTGGMAVGRTRLSGAPAAGATPRFLLMLVEGPAFRAAAPDSVAERVGEYVRWAGELRAEHRLVAADELGPGSVVVSPEGGSTGGGTHVAAADSSSRVTGFFLVTAADRDEAIRIAHDSPHLRYGGSIVVRDVVPH